MNAWPIIATTMCAAFSAAVAVYLSIELRKYRKIAYQLHNALHSARVIVDAYIEQGIGLTCGICGNQMSATERVDIVERSDGSFITAHPTHRLHTWE